MKFEEILDEINRYHDMYLNEQFIFIKKYLWIIIIELTKLLEEEATKDKFQID